MAAALWARCQNGTCVHRTKDYHLRNPGALILSRTQIGYQRSLARKSLPEWMGNKGLNLIAKSSSPGVQELREEQNTTYPSSKPNHHGNPQKKTLPEAAVSSFFHLNVGKLLVPFEETHFEMERFSTERQWGDSKAIGSKEKHIFGGCLQMRCRAPLQTTKYDCLFFEANHGLGMCLNGYVS